MQFNVSFARSDAFGEPKHKQRSQRSGEGTQFTIEAWTPENYRLYCSVHGLVASRMTVEEANVTMVRHNRERHSSREYVLSIRRFRTVGDEDDA